jgi:hypothetical protein
MTRDCFTNHLAATYEEVWVIKQSWCLIDKEGMETNTGSVSDIYNEWCRRYMSFATLYENRLYDIFQTLNAKIILVL